VRISIPGYPDSDDWQCPGLGPDRGRRRNGLLLSSTQTSLSVSCDYIPQLLVCLDACQPPIACLLPTHRARPAAPGFPPYSPQPSARWASQPSLHGSPKIGCDCVSEHLPLPDSCNSCDTPDPLICPVKKPYIAPYTGHGRPPLPHPNTAVHDILQFTSPVKTHVARKDPQAGKAPDRTVCERILQTISCLHFLP
jgi:hypothetical protein